MTDRDLVARILTAAVLTPLWSEHLREARRNIHRLVALYPDVWAGLHKTLRSTSAVPERFRFSEPTVDQNSMETILEDIEGDLPNVKWVRAKPSEGLAQHDARMFTGEGSKWRFTVSDYSLTLFGYPDKRQGLGAASEISGPTTLAFPPQLTARIIELAVLFVKLSEEMEKQ